LIRLLVEFCKRDSRASLKIGNDDNWQMHLASGTAQSVCHTAGEGAVSCFVTPRLPAMVKFVHNNSKADRIRLLPDTDGFEVLWPPLTDHIAAHAIVDGLTSAAKAESPNP